MMILTKKMTYEEFRNMEIPDGDTSIYELISGNIMRRSSPHSIHQIVQANLMRHFGNYAFDKQLGRVLGAPLDVVFSDDDSVQPDVFFIKKEREKIIEWNGPVWGSPDLIVEIISKGTGKSDRVDKFKLYQRFGVTEYWIIDPSIQTVEVFELINGKYEPQQFEEIEGTVKSSVLVGLELDLNHIFS
jgi:Uma2 family endonuclease